MIESFLNVTSTFILSLHYLFESIRIDPIDGSKYLMYSTGIFVFCRQLIFIRHINFVDDDVLNFIIHYFSDNSGENSVVISQESRYFIRETGIVLITLLPSCQSKLNSSDFLWLG